MKTIAAKLLSFVFILNTLFFGVSFKTFAADAFRFEWNKGSILDDGLNIVDKNNNYENVFLWWDFGKRNGSNFDKGTYTLNYNIQDGRGVEFIVDKSANEAVVTYKVKDYATNTYIPVADTLFQVYSDTQGYYITPDKEKFPNVSDNFGVIYDEADGKPKEASFRITQGTGFAFKFDNKTVKFQWVRGTDNDVMYFVTDGVTQGNIFDFNLNLDISGESKISQSLQVFTGINASSFSSKPYANDRKEEIDHTTRPYIDKDPGSDPTELVLTIAMPKVWDDTSKKYVFVDPASIGREDQTSLIVELGHNDDKKKIQVTVNDIYSNDVAGGTSYSTSGPGTATAERNGDDTALLVTIKNLEPGVIYNPVELSLYKPNKQSFLADVTNIDHGVVYTYPIYTIEAFSAEQYYLKIQPFEGYKGYYTVLSGATASTIREWARVEDSKGGTEPIYVPVNINAVNKQTQFFRVDFTFTPPDSTPGTDLKTLTSQILKYTPFESDVVISTPGNFKVLSAEIVPAIEGASTEKQLIMDLQWDMAYDTVLKNLVSNNGGSIDVFYDFNRGLKPYDENEQRFSEIKLHITLNGDVLDIEPSVVEGDAEIEKFEWDSYEVLIGTTRQTIIRPIVTFRLPTAPKEEENQLFLYPNVYFLNFGGHYMDNTTYVTIPDSLYDDVTLDDAVDYDVPQPQNVRVVTTGDNAVGKTSFTVDWDTFDIDDINSMIYEYRVKMLNSRRYDFNDESIKFNAYITQDKDAFDKLISFENDRESITDTLAARIKTHNFENKKAEAGLDVSALKDENGNILREDLRNNDIVKITNILHDGAAEKQSLSLTGLDKNQSYYVVLETVVIPYDTEKEIYLPEEEDISGYSQIVTATTLPDEDVPGPENNYPEAPENFTKDEITLNSVKLIWDRVVDSDEYENSSIEYQFIRINGEQMDQNIRASRKSYEEIWNDLKEGVNVNIAGWQTKEDSIYRFDGNSFSAEPVEANSFGYDRSDTVKNFLYDRTLSPNQLYFYYLRAMRVIDGKPVAYSIWVPLSVTTTPVESPYNLTVERSIKHDKEYEAVISFDTPYFDIDLLGTEYDIQYAIKKDTDLWSEPITMSAADLKGRYTENADGSLHFIYTIKGLEQGTMHFIKVRILNKTLNEASVYSNIVKTRTDIDQVDQDKKEEIEGWIDRYKELLEELLDDPYWILEDTTANTIVYYRPKHFGSVINSSPSGVIDLAVGEYGAKKTYYMPASAIKQAYDANKGFRVSWKGGEVVIGARAIDPALNQAVRQVLDRIDHDHIEDYFIKITAYFNEVSYTIDGVEPLSPVIDVEVDAVGSEDDIQEWDDERVDDIIEWIAEQIEDDYEDIVDEIEDSDKDEEMVKYIKDLVEDFNEDTYEEFLDDLDDIIDRTYATEELESNIIIAYPADQGVNVSARRQINGVWTGVSVSEYMGKKAIYTKNPGIYVFIGKAVIIPGISEIPNGQVITNIIAKYGLEDFLGKGTALNINAPLTRSAALGCSARIAGAQQTADPIAFFTSKGINLLVKSKEGNTTNQEGVYLVMMAYQTRTNKKIETIQIRNYTATSGINGIQPVFKKSIQAAFETGVYTNSGMNPSGIMTVKDYLQMLGNMSAKTNL